MKINYKTIMTGKFYKLIQVIYIYIKYTDVDNSMQVIFQAADLETPNPNEPNEKNC